MKPVTREEQYLNRLTGEEQEIPEEPVTREEQYLARLCGQTNSIPEKPVTRREEYLANLCGEDVIIPEEQVTRMEQYMAFAAGARETKPEEPVTREEWYWDKYQGGDVPEEKTIAFTDIITVTDALARPAVDLQSEITATQNLNGYDYPWVGGAGKNKLPDTLVSGNRTLSGVTFTTKSDGSVTINGTATATIYYGLRWRENPFIIPQGQYIVSGLTGSSAIIMIGKVSTNIAIANTDGYETFTLTEDTEAFAFIKIENGATLDNVTAYPMIRLASEADATYAPYKNICPISGRTEVNVTRTGKNIWDEEWEVGLIPSSNGQNAESNEYCRTKNYIDVSRIDNVYYSIVRPIYVRRYDANKNYLGSLLITESTSCHIPSDTAYLRFCWDGTTYNHDIAVNYPSTATEYEPYEGDTFNTELGRTVYGGTLDLTTGELTITHAYVDLGDLTWTVANLNVFQTQISEKKVGSTNFITTSYRTVVGGYADLANGEATSISPMTHGHIYTYVGIKDERATTAEEFTTLVTGQKMVYELATPQTISLTPTEVQMLENNNTIWADSGRVQLTYLSKAAQRVQSMNASLQANALKLSGLKKTTEEGGTTK